MGLRSRLKNTVKSVLGLTPGPETPSPVREPTPPAVPTPLPVREPPAPRPPVEEPPPPPPPEPGPPPVEEPPPSPEQPPPAPPPEVPTRLPGETPPAPPTELPPAPETPSEAPPASISDAAGPKKAVTFASDYETSDAPVRNAHHRARFQSSGIGYTVRVFNEAEGLDVTFQAESGEYVLEAAERAGYELPYSCRSGGCLTCSGKALQGTFEMGEQYVLEEEHQAAGYVLLCCTSVTSDAVFESHQQDNIQ